MLKVLSKTLFSFFKNNGVNVNPVPTIKKTNEVINKGLAFSVNDLLTNVTFPPKIS